MRKILFMAGSYGVGKSTLSNGITQKLGIKAFSASELIAPRNGESYGANKLVKDSSRNQEILISEMKKIEYDFWVLNGHFCIKGPENTVIKLEDEFFLQMNLSCILLITANPSLVYNNLLKRDQLPYSLSYITKLQNEEMEQAKKISALLGVDLVIYEMKYDGNDLENVCDIVRRLGELNEIHNA